MRQWLKAGVLFLLITSTSFSQEKLTLEQALAIALKNNFDIKIANNNLKSSEEDKVIKRATFLPKADMSVSTNKYDSNNDSYFGEQKRTDKVDTTYHSASLGVNLRINNIYDAVKDYIGSLNRYEQTIHTTKATIQATLMQVTRNYYDLMKQLNLMKISEQSVETNQKQVERAQSKYDIGSIAKKDVFTAKVQLNAAKTDLLNQKLAVQRAKNTLNISLGKNAFDQIDVYDNVNIENKFSDYKGLEAKLIEYNPDLKAEKNKIIDAEISYDRWFANMVYPVVGVEAGYNKNVGRETSIYNAWDRAIDTSRDFEFKLGFSISYNLFNGFSDEANLEKAEIQKFNAELNEKKKIVGLKAELYQAYITYKNRIEMLTLQEENLRASQEEYRLAQERFNIGSGTSLELKEAQDGVVRAESNLISAKYDAKIAEVDIDRLLGTIKVD